MINIATSEISNIRRPEFEAYLLASSAQRQVTIVAILFLQTFAAPCRKWLAASSHCWKPANAEVKNKGVHVSLLILLNK